MRMLVDRGREGAKIQFSCGRYIWMAPKGELERGPSFQAGPRPPTGLIQHCITTTAGYVLNNVAASAGLSSTACFVSKWLSYSFTFILKKLNKRLCKVLF